MLENLLRGRFGRMVGTFRSNVWDPVLIISQIISLQCQFIVTLGVWVYILNFICGYDTTIDQLFKQADKGLFTEGPGKANTIAYALNCLTSALGLWFIVGRTKQCLDFAITMHFIQFIICWIYNGHIPHTVSWWILNLCGVTLMTVLAEFLCMRTEIKAIPLGMGPKVDL
ncbi:protein SYS1 homolog [Mercenaria mercenaria]|uniref:protein SYS1 homolog n=1 Tax=Mercenaria mercenaria TaxID=6596 RepID=UPI001E1E1129|nr:protein SYS1 homolog [Mercenaria mercenaria]